MSQVSAAHNVVALAKDSKPFPLQRLARVIAKVSKDGTYPSEYLTESKCVSIPMIDAGAIAEHIESLIPHLRTLLEGAQDAIIRERIVENGSSAIHDDEINVGACVQYLEEAARGSRVTKEYLQAWFSEGYGSAAEKFIRTAIDGASEKIIEEKCNVIRDMFASFSSARFSPEIPKCRAVLRFIGYVGEDNCDARMLAIKARTQTILEKKESEMSADALGF